MNKEKLIFEYLMHECSSTANKFGLSAYIHSINQVEIYFDNCPGGGKKIKNCEDLRVEINRAENGRIVKVYSVSDEKA